MNLEKMFKMQADLDSRIIKEKGLEGQDLLPNTYVALITELGEFANEGRWFKHWSNIQEPKQPEYNWMTYRDDLEWKPEYGYKSYPLLEEYADCIHFFLSIAIKKGWQEDMQIPEEVIEDFKEEGLDGGLSGAFLEMQWSLLNSRMFKDEEKKKEHFRVAWGLFLAIGIVGFGFTPEQIEQAYIDKNAVNHKRQQEGY
ncbi:dUTP diphosphatase [Bacillus pumilus]|uniref:dUTP diphosphatase n=1 Tax=Bacillus pumilus TaxID=1408 RepID=UPI001C239552|nr:dUTP diphosphatase [Bacillus pumilus]MBU8575710.1 dUTP diphosphatase [Bacillus pumilus]